MEQKDLIQRTTTTIAKLLHRDFDCPVVIDGMEGDGKSIFAIKICAGIDPHFKIDRAHIVFRFGNLKKGIYALPRYAAIQDDEIGLHAFNRQAMTKFNIELVQALIVCRDQNKALVCCVPSIWILDPYIKNHRAKYWFHVYTVEYKGLPIRGFVEVRKSVPNKWGEKPYWNLLGTYRFKNLPEDIRTVYKQLKHDALQEQVDDTHDSPQKDRDAIILDALKRKIKGAEIGRVTGLSQQRISQIGKALINHP